LRLIVINRLTATELTQLWVSINKI